MLATTHPYLSVCLALALVTDHLPFASALNFENISTAFVTYNTVVFGFTATAIALAIAIPNSTFIKFLSARKEIKTPYEDFLFILAWNGFVHFVSFFVLMPILFFGKEWWHNEVGNYGVKVYLFVFFSIQLYCCFQFLVTTLSIFELADLYAKFVAKDKGIE
ncbi:MAG TPA: hypothetical protein VHC00_07780 [Rhizobiaceae bacterium]|nr:hypothetical protein [Rhizobiaceae bacterium]